MSMKEREGYHKRVMEKELDLEQKRENATMINRVSNSSNLTYVSVASKTIRGVQVAEQGLGRP